MYNVNTIRSIRKMVKGMCHRKMSHPFFLYTSPFFFYPSPFSSLNIHHPFSLLYLETRSLKF